MRGTVTPHGKLSTLGSMEHVPQSVAGLVTYAHHERLKTPLVKMKRQNYYYLTLPSQSATDLGITTAEKKNLKSVYRKRWHTQPPTHTFLKPTTEARMFEH